MPLKSFKAKLNPEVSEHSLFTKRDLLSTALAGELTSALKGHGIEFEDFRDYTPADDANRIDWRASKRAQRTLVREYKMEVNLSIFMLIDVSESMLFSSTKKLKCEYAAEIVTSLIFGLLKTGDAVGFGFFNDKLLKVFKPKLSMKQYYTFTKEVAKPNLYGGKKNIGKAIEQITAILKRKSLIFLISDFISADEELAEYLKLISTRHEVIGINIRDPLDNEIPSNAGQIIIEDPFSKKKMYIDAHDYAPIYNSFNHKDQKKLQVIFEHAKSSLLDLRTDVPPLNQMITFFKRRGGRWR